MLLHLLCPLVGLNIRTELKHGCRASHAVSAVQIIVRPIWPLRTSRFSPSQEPNPTHKCKMKTPLTCQHGTVAIIAFTIAGLLPNFSMAQVDRSEEIPQAPRLSTSRRASIDARNQAVDIAGQAAIAGDYDRAERILVDFVHAQANAKDRAVEEYGTMASLVYRLMGADQNRCAYEVALRLLDRVGDLEASLTERADQRRLAQVYSIEGDIRDRLLTDREGAIDAYENARWLVRDQTNIRVRLDRLKQERELSNAPRL